MIEIGLKYEQKDGRQISIPTLTLKGKNNLSISEIAMIFVMLKQGLYTNAYVDAIAPFISEEQMIRLSNLVEQAVGSAKDLDRISIERAKIPIVNPDSTINEVEQ